MEYKVIDYGSVSELNRQVKEMIENGWKPVGSHQVVVKHVQNRFAGMQHKDSVSSMEYSQTMIKDDDKLRNLFNRYNEFIAHHEPDEWDEWIERNIK
jgi:hypothetical protein